MYPFDLMGIMASRDPVFVSHAIYCNSSTGQDVCLLPLVTAWHACFRGLEPLQRDAAGFEGDRAGRSTTERDGARRGFGSALSAYTFPYQRRHHRTQPTSSLSFGFCKA